MDGFTRSALSFGHNRKVYVSNITVSHVERAETVVRVATSPNVGAISDMGQRLPKQVSPNIQIEHRPITQNRPSLHLLSPTKPVISDILVSSEVPVDEPTLNVFSGLDIDNDGVAVLDTHTTQIRRYIVYLAIALGAFFVVGVALVMSRVLLNHSSQSVSSGDRPAVGNSIGVVPTGVKDTPPDNYLNSYKVDAGQPRSLEVQSLGLHARVLPVGVDGRSQPQLPLHSYDVGWYNVSSVPGNDGVSVMSGSCVASSGGAFEKIHELKKGDSVVVERGDGTRYSYGVERLEVVKVGEVDMAAILKTNNSGSQALSLITCSGLYSPENNDFTERLIVFARQI